MDDLVENPSSILIPTNTKNSHQKESNNEKNDNGVSPIIEISDVIMEKTLFSLYQLIIQNAKNLIVDHQSELFINNFDKDSDIITIMDSIYFYTKEHKKYENNSGFSISIINSIYKSLEEKFNVNGQNLIIAVVERLKSQKKKIDELIDSFIKDDISKNNLQLEECQGCFNKVIGARTESNPILIYKIKISGENNYKTIEFSRRPGMINLDCPRNIIILSKYHDNEKDIDHGVLFHRDSNFDIDDYGIKSYEIFFDSFNYFFFNYLFGAYWNDRVLSDDFIEIYNTLSPDKNSSSIFHITKYEIFGFINFCPRNKSINELVINTIKNCFYLLPFFPKSILFKIDNPLCAIDFIGKGNLNDYTTNIYIINENHSECPIPYPLNKTTLDFAISHIHKLAKINSPLWFSITGENFFYKEFNGREIEAKFSNPNIDINAKSVFDSQHPSHIVLLIDQNYAYKPKNVSPLSWLPFSEIPMINKELFNGSNIENSTEELNNEFHTKNDQMILKISSQIINNIGNIEQNSDLFFITLSGGFPIVSEGYIPESIQGLIEYATPDGNLVIRSIYHLIKHFSKRFITNQMLTEPIHLKKISSTDHWKNYPKNEEMVKKITTEICMTIKKKFNIDEQNINAQFLGPSLILLKINCIPENLVKHKETDDIWNDEYQSCIADEIIKSILNENKKIDIQVTDVIHEPLIKMKIFHKKSFGIDQKKFMNQIDKISNMFGFYKLSISNYIENNESEKDDIIGFCQIELISSLVSIVFSTMINEEFKNIKSEHNIKEIETIRQVFAMDYTEQYKNDKQKILIIPSSNDATRNEMLQSVKDMNNNSICLNLCDDPKTYLSQCLYIYDVKFEYETIEAYSICRECCIDTFKNIKDLQNTIRPQTHMIDRTKISQVYNLLKSFLFIDDNNEIYGESFPKIPYGQGIWTLLVGDDLISHYIKMWFTINMNVIIRTSPHYFICCPFHNNVIYATPKDDNVIICPKCNSFFHSKCQFWHFLNDKCPILKENKKRCPNCFVCTEKISGCNHIICRCGKHWCFQCEHSPIFKDASLCYEHMSKEHGNTYVFYRNAIHIYLNPQNEIVKLEMEKLTLSKFIPLYQELIIHDHQNGDQLQICAYDGSNLLYKYRCNYKLEIENIYDYDLVISVDEAKSILDDEYWKPRICYYFGYSIAK